MQPGLRVLLVGEDLPVVAAVTVALERRGHEVAVVETAAQALAARPPDILVTHATLPDARGTDLIAAFRARSSAPRSVWVAQHDAWDERDQALAAGACRVLCRPFRLDELLGAIESLAAGDATSAPGGFERAYPCAPGVVEHATRDLLAWALAQGIPPSTRARLGAALSEVVDNARRHGYPGRLGWVRLRARLDEGELAVRVRDDGAGFDPSTPEIGATKRSTRFGFGRAAALSEDLAVDSAPHVGTHVTLRFRVGRVDLDGGRQIDLSELDYLDPDGMRRLLHALSRPETADLYLLPPSLAVVAGRLLAGPRAPANAREALWS